MFLVLFTIRRYCYFVFISKEIILCSITYYHAHNKYLQRIYSTIIFKWLFSFFTNKLSIWFAFFIFHFHSSFKPKENLQIFTFALEVRDAWLPITFLSLSYFEYILLLNMFNYYIFFLNVALLFPNFSDISKKRRKVKKFTPLCSLKKSVFLSSKLRRILFSLFLNSVF